jgi:acyl carrier protein
MSMTTVSKEEIFSKVQEALVDALGVEEDEVKPEATLQGDLDAESIDFLDIVFRLEKAFGIKIERGELFPEDILTDTDFVEDGKVNSAGIAKLKQRMPFADLSKFEANPAVQNLGKQLTVEDMCNFVKYKLSA